jgi:hypothetical protein
MIKKVVKILMVLLMLAGIVISFLNFTAVKSDAKITIWGFYEQDIVEGHVVGERCTGDPSTCCVIIMEPKDY